MSLIIFCHVLSLVLDIDTYVPFLLLTVYSGGKSKNILLQYKISSHEYLGNEN